jgi:DNA-binding PucR family transcriptional regulator
VAQTGVTSFVEWARRPEAVQLTGDPFRAAPRELVRAVSLQQVVELVRIAVEVVEDAVPDLVDEGDEQAVRELVLRYSRELAFAAAGVYANAAEERGAWDARLEALVVDAVVRGDADDALLSRASALGWGSPTRVTVVAGLPPDDEPEAIVDDAHRVATAAGLDVLAGVSSERLVVLVGLTGTPSAAARALLPAFGEGPVVVGHTAADLRSAGSSARAALAAAAAVAGWPEAPRPVDAAELLPERALNGDADARAELVRIYRTLAEEGTAVLDTVATYLEVGASLEATGRALFLHPNTVRYRLRKAADVCAFDPTHPRDAFALRMALTLGRLTDL